MMLDEDVRRAFIRWYEGLTQYNGFPAKGTIGGALVILERLKRDFDLSIDKHTAKGGTQIKGASGAAVRSILKEFGERRTFLSEGGRTNRGLRGDIMGMLEAIRGAGLDSSPPHEREPILKNLQGFLVDRVRDFHSQQRLEIMYDPARSTWQAIHDILDKARAGGKEGPVAQYLVGAKLQLRFPGIEIGNESYSTADAQLGRRGDFLVGNTVFHVTVAPTPAVYEKCQRNLNEDLRVYLLVRDRSLAGTKQNAELASPGRIAVESIETFVSQNIDELGAFSRSQMTREFRHLLEIYNRRVELTEMVLVQTA